MEIHESLTYFSRSIVQKREIFFMGLIQLILILPSLCVFHILCMDCSNKLQPGDHCKKLEKNKGCRCKFLSLLPVQCRQSPFLALAYKTKKVQVADALNWFSLFNPAFAAVVVISIANLRPPFSRTDESAVEVKYLKINR